MLKRSRLYLHTLKHLKPAQLWGRVWLRFYRPSVGTGNIPAVRPVDRTYRPCGRPPSLLGIAHFIFLNKSVDFGEFIDWQRPDLPLLWLYNLHYFDDLNAEAANAREKWHNQLIADWVTKNPPTVGVGWQSYPISLRSVNWIKWHLAGSDLTDAALSSLAMQVRYLRKRLEIHLLGNHLWANAKALVFAGCFFEGEEADEWLEKGLKLIKRELSEQVLGDGGHFELSPMYHAIVLEDLLDLVQLATLYPQCFGDSLRDGCIQRISAMLSWLSAMSHPDGGISFFNDATHGIAPDLPALTRYASMLNLPGGTADAITQLLTDSGYARAQNVTACLIADVGSIGPNYLPGHAHADTLSFELSLFGQRVIVNQGIDRYGADQERLRQRGTAAHSTVELDEQDSSEVWSGFRVARRAYPQQRSFETSEVAVSIHCAHDGYRRLPGRVIHQRSWVLTEEALMITDNLKGTFSKAVAFFHLHPSIRIVSVGLQGCVLDVDGNEVDVTITGGELSLCAGSYHPGFGISESTKTLQVLMTSAQLSTIIRWVGSSI
jgi:uncharacterized heparinase superfamily protein